MLLSKNFGEGGRSTSSTHCQKIICQKQGRREGGQHQFGQCQQIYCFFLLTSPLINYDKSKHVVCEICSLTLKSMKGLENHKKAKHNDDGTCFFCSECGISKDSRKQLENHQRRHKTAICPHCSKDNILVVCSTFYARKLKLALHLCFNSQRRMVISRLLSFLACFY